MQYIRPGRTVSVLAIMCLLVLALAPAALAQAPEGVPTGQPDDAGEELGASNAASLQRMADRYHGWAEDYALAVQEWTDCVRDSASSNGDGEDDDADVDDESSTEDSTVEGDEVEYTGHPLVDCYFAEVNESPGLLLTGQTVSFDEAQIE